MLAKLLSPPEFKEIQDYCHQRYGVGYQCWSNRKIIKTKEALWVISDSMYKFFDLAQIDYESAGLRCFSGREFPYKITNSFYHIFNTDISKGRLNLSVEHAKKLLSGESIELRIEGNVRLEGYVLMFVGETFFGIGLKKGDQVISQIPKSFRSQLGKGLEICND